MTKTTKEQTYKPAYKMGRLAYVWGSPDSENPYGKGDLMNRCAWSAGWHDKRREGNKNG